MTVRLQADFLKLIAIVSFVSIACFVVFLLPLEIQNMLKVKHAVFNPLTYVTASFVQKDIEALKNNLSFFILFTFLLYFINNKSGKMQFFFYSVLIMLTILPLLNYSLLFYFGIYRNIEFGFGLSLVDSGLIGFTLPSLILFFKDRLKEFNPMLFIISMFWLTTFLVFLSYACTYTSFQLLLLVLCVVFGFIIGISEFKRILRFVTESFKQRVTWMESFVVVSILLSYFISIVSLFPSEIALQGGILDIRSHYIGLLFGILPFSLYGFRQKKDSGQKITFMSIMKMNDLDRKVCDTVADRTLTLAGFTLAALTFIIGFYKENLASASTLLLSLLLAMFLFFLGSQLAHEAEYFWQIFSADILQYFGIITLMVSFSYFINENLRDKIVLLFPLFLVIILVLYLVRGALRIYEFYRKFKSLKETNTKVR